MTLEEQLTQIRENGFARMPIAIVEVLIDGIKEISESDLKQNALKTGDKAPDASFLNTNGQPTLLSSLLKNDYLIINFYRGGWCPYCNLELRTYESLKADFNKLGANIVAISAEKPELIAQTSQKNTITFPVLSDENALVMKQFGIVFQLNEKLKKEYTNFGLDLNNIHGNSNFELPVPAVYIIDKAFNIVFTHFEADYTTRLEPKTLLNVLKK
ncbi:peroxiredoxin-like family protein [uncultured Algibacter sp.]|uniref:peroxiredoxin-like family protein n=1 Tax=uncultured Algibacter sp. TaxID=298659 RepID=UPI00321718C8